MHTGSTRTRSWPLLCVLALALAVGANPLISGLTPTPFAAGALIPAKVNTLVAAKAPAAKEDFYVGEGFCRPDEGIRYDRLSVSEVLAGVKRANSPYLFCMGASTDRRERAECYRHSVWARVPFPDGSDGSFDAVALCSVHLAHEASVERLRELIDGEYHIRLLAGPLPAVLEIKYLAHHSGYAQHVSQYMDGFPVGMRDQAGNYQLFNHINITLYYEPYSPPPLSSFMGGAPPTKGAYQLVRFEVRGQIVGDARVELGAHINHTYRVESVEGAPGDTYNRQQEIIIAPIPSNIDWLINLGLVLQALLFVLLAFLYCYFVNEVIRHNMPPSRICRATIRDDFEFELYNEEARQGGLDEREAAGVGQITVSDAAVARVDVSAEPDVRAAVGAGSRAASRKTSRAGAARRRPAPSDTAESAEGEIGMDAIREQTLATLQAVRDESEESWQARRDAARSHTGAAFTQTDGLDLVPTAPHLLMAINTAGAGLAATIVVVLAIATHRMFFLERPSALIFAFAVAHIVCGIFGGAALVVFRGRYTARRRRYIGAVPPVCESLLYVCGFFVVAFALVLASGAATDVRRTAGEYGTLVLALSVYIVLAGGSHFLGILLLIFAVRAVRICCGVRLVDPARRPQSPVLDLNGALTARILAAHTCFGRTGIYLARALVSALCVACTLPTLAAAAMLYWNAYFVTPPYKILLNAALVVANYVCLTRTYSFYWISSYNPHWHWIPFTFAVEWTFWLLAATTAFYLSYAYDELAPRAMFIYGCLAALFALISLAVLTFIGSLSMSALVSRLLLLQRQQKLD